MAARVHGFMEAHTLSRNPVRCATGFLPITRTSACRLIMNTPCLLRWSHGPTGLAWLASLLLAGPLVALHAGAAEIHVPADHPDIQAAIDAGQAGDVVVVAPGRYPGPIVLRAGILVRSVGNDEPGRLGLLRAERTVIDGLGTDRPPGVTMAEGATLDGFTVTGFGTFDQQEWQHQFDRRGENQPRPDGNEAAISADGVGCRIVNNLAHDNGGPGIRISGGNPGAANGPVHVVVAGNTCHRNSGAGISAVNGASGIIENNHCFNNLRAGIGHSGASPLVIGNDCHGNVRAGIGISNGASPVVRGNRCHGNGRAGIGIRSGPDTRPVVEDNDCFENGMAGIGIDDESMPVVRHNRCHRNRLAGIGMRGTSSAIIVDNDASDNHAAGIGAESGRAVIVGNRLQRNHTVGIGLGGDTRALLAENHCEENRLVAIGLPDRARALMWGNHLQRTAGGPPMVAVLGTSQATLIDNVIKGGGVAGILVEGRARLLANQLNGNGGGSGVLARDGSQILLDANEISGFSRETTTGEGAAVSHPQPR